ncbi:MAG: tyrosine-type recombinase/integrase [Proteobacteria bacterium]|nr:tyrosine-type recombinase/integrase [Pseudomonadota bacterium]
MGNYDIPYLFPGRIEGEPLKETKTFWRRVFKEAQLEEVRIHDLHHTHASHLVSSGLSLSIVGKLLGHTQASTTQRYAHLADQPLRQAAELFGSKVGNQPSNEGYAMDEERKITQKPIRLVLSKIRSGDFAHPGDEEAVKLVLKNLQGKYNISNTGSVLDVGCGFGGTLGYLKSNGFSYLHGVDIDPIAINHANQHHKKGVAFLLKLGNFSTIGCQPPFI